MSAGWLAAFLAVTAIVFMLPLLPALVEWRRRADAAPLTVVRAHDGQITHFAATFRRFLEANLPPLDDDPAHVHAVRDIALNDGGSCQVVGGDGVPRLDDAELAAGATRTMVVGRAPLSLPDGVLFETEMYAAQGIAGGSRNALRALLSDGDVLLGDGIGIIRWAHAAGRFACGPGSRLAGRVSSDTAIHLQRDTTFGRMRAPVILFGDDGDGDGGPAGVRPAHADARATLARPADLLDDGCGRWLVGGALDIAGATAHRGDLVVRGALTVGRGSRIDGGCKGQGWVDVGADAVIAGAVVSTGRLHIGAGARIAGPVVAEGTVVIDAGSVIGSPSAPTTVTADRVRVAEGAVIHGSVWPRIEGTVVACAGAVGDEAVSDEAARITAGPAAETAAGAAP